MSYIVTTLMDMSPVEVLSVVFRVCFLVGCGYPTGFRGCAAWSGVWGWCVRGERDYARVHRRLVCGWVFMGVGVYKEPPGAWCSTGGPCDGECGGVLLSHILSGAVPSPCQALASGFGMGPGVSPGPWPPQIFNSSSRPHGDGGWFRVAVREPEDGRDVSLFRAS